METVTSLLSRCNSRGTIASIHLDQISSLTTQEVAVVKPASTTTATLRPPTTVLRSLAPTRLLHIRPQRRPAECKLRLDLTRPVRYTNHQRMAFNSTRAEECPRQGNMGIDAARIVILFGGCKLQPRCDVLIRQPFYNESDESESQCNSCYM